jgi:hypothetical protein
MKRTASASAVAVLMLTFTVPLCGAQAAAAQKPLIDDDRMYSAADKDRGYVAARCAALFLAMSEVVAPANSEHARSLGNKAFANSASGSVGAG